MSIIEDVAGYEADGRIPPFPQTVHIDLINVCNLKCPQCWNHSPLLSEKKSAEWKSLKLSYGNFKTIVMDLKETGVPKLILSGGGEPFCHKKIYKMIGFAKKRKFRVTVLSNGHMIDVDTLLKAPPDRLLINLGAATRSVFKALYPRLELFRQEDLIGKLKKLNLCIPMTLVMVITNLNYLDIPAYVTMAARFANASVSFKLANLGPDTAVLELTRQMKERLLDDLLPDAERRCRESGIPNDIPLLKSRLSLPEGEYLAQKTGCYTGLIYSRIYSTGEVLYCCAHMKTGNALAVPFRTIWQGPEYALLRAALSKKQFLPQCRTCGKINLNHSVHETLQQAGHG